MQPHVTNRLKCERPIKAKSFINDLELSVSFISQQRRRANAQLTHLQIWETELFPLPSSNTENFIVKRMSLKRITAHANLQRSCVNRIRKEASNQNRICCQDRWEQLSPLTNNNNNFLTLRLEVLCSSVLHQLDTSLTDGFVSNDMSPWNYFRFFSGVFQTKQFEHAKNTHVHAYKEHSLPTSSPHHHILSTTHSDSFLFSIFNTYTICNPDYKWNFKTQSRKAMWTIIIWNSGL